MTTGASKDSLKILYYDMVKLDILYSTFLHIKMLYYENTAIQYGNTCLQGRISRIKNMYKSLHRDFLKICSEQKVQYELFSSKQYLNYILVI